MYRTWFLLAELVTLAFILASGQDCHFSVNLFGDDYHIITLNEFQGDQTPTKVTFDNNQMIFFMNNKNYVIDENGEYLEYDRKCHYKRRLSKLVNDYTIRVKNIADKDNRFIASFSIDLEHTFVIKKMENVVFALQIINDKTKLLIVKPTNMVSKHSFIPAHPFKLLSGDVLDFEVSNDSKSALFCVKTPTGVALKLMKRVHKCFQSTTTQHMISLIRKIESNMIEECETLQKVPTYVNSIDELKTKIKNLEKEYKNEHEILKKLIDTLNNSKNAKISETLSNKRKRESSTMSCIEAQLLESIQHTVDKTGIEIIDTLKKCKNDLDTLSELTNNTSITNSQNGEIDEYPFTNPSIIV